MADRLLSRSDEIELADSRGADAPEYRMSLRMRRDLDAEGASVQLVVRWPFGGETAFLDLRQVETLRALLDEALPELRRAEADMQGEWSLWHATADVPPEN